MSSQELFGDGHRTRSSRDRQGSPCTDLAVGTAPPRGLRLGKGLLFPALATFLSPGSTDPPTDTLLWSCLLGVFWQEEEGERKACQLCSLLSRQDFPVSSQLVFAAVLSASEQGSLYSIRGAAAHSCSTGALPLH